MKRTCLLLCSVSLCAPAWAQNANRTPEDDFAELQVAARPLPLRPPASGQNKTAQENLEDQQRQAAGFALAASKAKDFYTKNPGHAKAAEAKKIESVSLLRAVQAGMVAEEPKALRLAAEFRGDSSQSSASRYEVATLMTQMDIGKKKIKDRGPLMDEHERQALSLLGEFPNEPEIYEYFLGIARNSDAVKARALVQRVLLMPASAAQKEQARAIVARLDLPGSSPALEWADDKGVARRVNDHRGKITVFFVWASWAGESERGAALVAPAIKPGIELVSVNVDTDVKKGQDARKKLTLPGGDYFDERGLQSPLPQQLKADKVPAVHVVDANGVYIGRGAPAELAGLLQKAAK